MFEFNVSDYYFILQFKYICIFDLQAGSSFSRDDFFPFMTIYHI